jgi:chemosensory pili system protein ChpE
LFAAIVDRVLGRAGVRWARTTYRLCAIVFLALALASLRELFGGEPQGSSERNPKVRQSRTLRFVRGEP